MIDQILIEEPELRSWLAKELGRPVSEGLWKHLEDHDYVQDAQTGIIPRSELLREARSALSAAGGQDSRPKTTHVEQEQSGRTPDDQPRIRSYVISQLFALEANKLEAVRRFRDGALAGELLKAEQIPDWIKGTAEAEAPPTRWLDGVPLPDDRKVEAVEERISIEPPMEVGEGAYVQLREINFFANGTYGEDISVAIRTGGVLDRLLGLCNRLSWRYGWDQPQAVSFVLTGGVPTLKPVELNLVVRAPFEAVSRINLSIDPTVSPRDLAEYYGNIRRQLVGDRYRGLSWKHLSLALFLGQNSELTWEQRMAKWNQIEQDEHPDWCYAEDDLRNFTRDCKHAEERLLHPKFTITA